VAAAFHFGTVIETYTPTPTHFVEVCEKKGTYLFGSEKRACKWLKGKDRDLGFS
jgi:hypothetical protein